LLKSFVLDDKIELNQPDIATLEAIAQAIFKEWFVYLNTPAPPANWSKAPRPPSKAGEVGVLGDLCNVIKGFSYMRASGASRTALVTLNQLSSGDLIKWV
jgi:restriction endonuclease S subunit